MIEIDQNFLKNKKIIRTRLEKEGLEYVWVKCARKVNANIKLNNSICHYYVPDSLFGNHVYSMDKGIRYITRKLKNTPNIEYDFVSPNLFIIHL